MISFEGAIDTIRETLEMTAEIYKSLPDREKPKRIRCLTPVFAAWGKEFPDRIKHTRKFTPEQIDIADFFMLDLLPSFHSDRNAQLLLWGRANRIPFKVLAYKLGISPKWAKVRHSRALSKLAYLIATRKRESPFISSLFREKEV